jgi:riboflavin kinase/FMN adenylyltransferase
VLTIGFYDGVHLGHRRTIGRALGAAHSSGHDLIVVTFDRHPSEVVRSHRAPKLLCDLTQRLELFASLGVDATFVIEFDEPAAQRTPAKFIQEVLVDQLGAAEIIVGWDFRFGAGREGDIAVLTDAGQHLGFTVSGVTLGEADGEVISSTRIRSLVAAGDVAEAARLLGRVHELRGTVVHGDGRGGADLGFPTVNLAVDPRFQLPRDGVYAGWYRDAEHTARPAAISVGRRPTFYDDAEPLVEAHLLEFEGDLYGRTARVSFLERLRGDERFDSAEALITQMLADVEVTRTLCATLAEQAPTGLEGSQDA